MILIYFIRFNYLPFHVIPHFQQIPDDGRFVMTPHLRTIV